MSGEHEKGSHGDGGGEGYLKYLDGSLRDEANQGRPVPKMPSVDIVEDGTPGPGTAMEIPRPLQMGCQPGRWTPRAPAARTVLRSGGQTRPGQAGSRGSD